MRARKLFVLVFLAAISAAYAADPEYSGAEAGKHVGETAIVTDKAERVNTASGGSVFINLGSRGRDAFTIFIPSRDAAAVGDVKQYEGKTISVSGKISTHNEKPQIVVTAASQITVKDEGQVASDVARPSPSPSPKK